MDKKEPGRDGLGKVDDTEKWSKNWWKKVLEEMGWPLEKF